MIDLKTLVFSFGVLFVSINSFLSLFDNCHIISFALIFSAYIVSLPNNESSSSLDEYMPIDQIKVKPNVLPIRK